MALVVTDESLRQFLQGHLDILNGAMDTLNAPPDKQDLDLLAQQLVHIRSQIEAMLFLSSPDSIEPAIGALPGVAGPGPFGKMGMQQDERHGYAARRGGAIVVPGRDPNEAEEDNEGDEYEEAGLLERLSTLAPPSAPPEP